MTELLQTLTPPKTIFWKLKEWTVWAMKLKNEEIEGVDYDTEGVDNEVRCRPFPPFLAQRTYLFYMLLYLIKSIMARCKMH